MIFFPSFPHCPLSSNQSHDNKNISHVNSSQALKTGSIRLDEILVCLRIRDEKYFPTVHVAICHTLSPWLTLLCPMERSIQNNSIKTEESKGEIKFHDTEWLLPDPTRFRGPAWSSILKNIVFDKEPFNHIHWSRRITKPEHVSPRLTGNQSERQIQKHRHEVPEVAQLLAGLKNGKKRPNDWSRAENW